MPFSVNPDDPDTLQSPEELPQQAAQEPAGEPGPSGLTAEQMDQVVGAARAFLGNDAYALDTMHLRAQQLGYKLVRSGEQEDAVHPRLLEETEASLQGSGVEWLAPTLARLVARLSRGQSAPQPSQ